MLNRLELSHEADSMEGMEGMLLYHADNKWCHADNAEWCRAGTALCHVGTALCPEVYQAENPLVMSL